MSNWSESPASPAPGVTKPEEILRLLSDAALAAGRHELVRAMNGTGILRLNISLSLRHGKPQGSTSGLVFEEKRGYE